MLAISLDAAAVLRLVLRIASKLAPTKSNAFTGITSSVSVNDAYKMNWQMPRGAAVTCRSQLAGDQPGTQPLCCVSSQDREHARSYEEHYVRVKAIERVSDAASPGAPGLLHRLGHGIDQRLQVDGFA